MSSLPQMTPARKAALQWFYDRGVVSWLASLRNNAPSKRLFHLMQRDGQLVLTSEGWTLTDKGRRDLHGAR